MEEHIWVPGDRFRNIHQRSVASYGDEGVFLGQHNVDTQDIRAWVLYDRLDLRAHFDKHHKNDYEGYTGCNTKTFESMEFVCHTELLPAMLQLELVITKKPEPVPDPVPEQTQSLWSLPKTW